MEHYYSKQQSSELKITEVETRLRGNGLKIKTGSGVFSIGKVDKGTLLLIEKCIVEDGWKVLDIGCGYGVVGVALAKAFSNLSIVMSDVNMRAIKLSKMNITENKVENVFVKYSEVYSKIKDKFDTILSNPPQSAGKDVCFSIITGAKEHLVKGGLLQVVARHNKGGKQLSEKMMDVFGNVEGVAKKGGYRVYVSKQKFLPD